MKFDEHDLERECLTGILQEEQLEFQVDHFDAHVKDLLKMHKKKKKLAAHKEVHFKQDTQLLSFITLFLYNYYFIL